MKLESIELSLGANGKWQYCYCGHTDCYESKFCYKTYPAAYLGATRAIRKSNNKPTGYIEHDVGGIKDNPPTPAPPATNNEGEE